MATTKLDYYDVLTVTQGAGHETIENSYRKLSMQFHSDKSHGNQEVSQIH